MSTRELRLAAEAIKLAKAYNDCCPDVGMGPSIETLAEDLMKPIGYSDKDIAIAIEQYESSQ